MNRIIAHRQSDVRLVNWIKVSMVFLGVAACVWCSLPALPTLGRNVALYNLEYAQSAARLHTAAFYFPSP